MSKSLIIMMVLLILSVNAYTAQCPLYSDWLLRIKPQKNQPQSWELNQYSRNHGWRSIDYYDRSYFNTDLSDSRDLTQVPYGASLNVIIEYKNGDTVYCVYRSDGKKIAAAMNAMHDIQRRSDGIVDSRAYFIWQEGAIWPSYICKTNAMHPENCYWNWKHGERSN